MNKLKKFVKTAGTVAMTGFIACSPMTKPIVSSEPTNIEIDEQGRKFVRNVYVDYTNFTFNTATQPDKIVLSAAEFAALSDCHEYQALTGTLLEKVEYLALPYRAVNERPVITAEHVLAERTKFVVAADALSEAQEMLFYCAYKDNYADGTYEFYDGGTLNYVKNQDNQLTLISNNSEQIGDLLYAQPLSINEPDITNSR